MSGSPGSSNHFCVRCMNDDRQSGTDAPHLIYSVSSIHITSKAHHLKTGRDADHALRKEVTSMIHMVIPVKQTSCKHPIHERSTMRFQLVPSPSLSPRKINDRSTVYFFLVASTFFTSRPGGKLCSSLSALSGSSSTSV